MNKIETKNGRRRREEEKSEKNRESVLDAAANARLMLWLDVDEATDDINMR